MSALDVKLQTLLLYYIFPFFVVPFVVWKYVLPTELKSKYEAFFTHKVCFRIHSNMCGSEKKTLLNSMGDLKKKFNVDSLNILEIGIGSGLNLRDYPPWTTVTGVEPNSELNSYVKRSESEANNDVKVVKFINTFAENMAEAESESFHAVVGTLTLCTVRDPAAVLKEVHRVLRPGGVYYFLEHVAGENGSFTRWCQNWIQLIWPYFFYGCSINRETWTFLDKSRFKDIRYNRFAINSPFPLFFFRPFMYGTATKKAM